MTSKNLYQRRNDAKKKVFEHEFSKVKTGELKYAYLPIEQIKPIVEDAYNAAGIVMDIISLDLTEVMPPDIRTSTGYDGNPSKSTWLHMRGTLTIKLVNMDEPSDCVTVEVIGEAKDNSDKVTSKVYTSAIKNFYKAEFNISEGPKDDTDATQSDADLEKQSKATPKKNETKRFTTPSADPFFSGKKAEPVAEIDDAALNTGLLKAGKDPAYAPIIKEAVTAGKVASVTQLPRDIKLQLMARIEEGTS